MRMDIEWPFCILRVFRLNKQTVRYVVVGTPGFFDFFPRSFRKLIKRRSRFYERQSSASWYIASNFPSGNVFFFLFLFCFFFVFTISFEPVRECPAPNPVPNPANGPTNYRRLCGPPRRLYGLRRDDDGSAGSGGR